MAIIIHGNYGPTNEDVCNIIDMLICKGGKIINIH
jgi:hypothetical protein